MLREGKTYIFSWGGGVNSTAILAMIKLGMLPELTKDNTHIVFADTGAEMPYTYEHTSNCLQPMAKEGWVCKAISPHTYQEFYSGRCQNRGLSEYCIEKQVIPSRVNRWCTMEYKSKPIKQYRKSLNENWEEVVLILGIANDELKRAKFLGHDHTYYPLIEKSIDREGCIKLIAQAKLPTARKSGCYLCPFQGKAQWIELYRNYPEYFKKVEQIENIAREKFGGKAYYFIRDIPLKDQINKWLAKEKEECKQGDLFELDRHCLCEL
jgi:3'-phosphoadenosine 5'-phosphosulfate sulfotransferase (PAPS reductase)/FAD synthetase